MIHYRSIKTELIFTGRVIIDSINLIGGTTNSNIVINDSTDGSGNDVVEIKVLANTSQKIDFGQYGLTLDNGIYSTISGTGAKVDIYVK